MRKTIVLSFDQNFMMPAETLIKSIAAHNCDIDIDVINEDIAPEWFMMLNDRLAPLRITVNDLKYQRGELDNLPLSVGNLTKMTYGRFLIPQMVSADRVLYLDVDTVVERNLDDLFNYDMHGHVLGAVITADDPIFNAGVLLIDNAQLKGTNFTTQMLQRSQTAHLKDDQSILNELYQDNYEHLPYTYNVQVGDDLIVAYSRKYAEYEERLKTADPFTIIHFTGGNKPWGMMNGSRWRNRWWYYHNLEFSEAVAFERPHMLAADQAKRPQFFAYVTSQNLAGIEELVKALPEADFHVAAFSTFGALLPPLLRYRNFHLHEQVNDLERDELIQRADAYLDICEGDYDQPSLDILSTAANRGLPILSFDHCKFDQAASIPSYQVFADGDYSSMIKRLQEVTSQH